MRNRWGLVYYVLYGCVAVGLAIWLFLLGTICASPTQQNPTTNYVIEYNCHGTIVFIQPIQNFLLRWLIPILFLVMAAGAFARDKSHSQ